MVRLLKNGHPTAALDLVRIVFPLRDGCKPGVCKLIPGGLDTRKLVRHIRKNGAMNAIISSEIHDEAELMAELKKHGVEFRRGSSGGGSALEAFNYQPD